MLCVVEACRREIWEFPEEIRSDLADAVARLQEGQMLMMPLSRPMPSVGHRVHELRLKDRSGIYRVFYYLAGQGRIYLLHAFKKKTQETPWHNIQLAQKRLREVKHET